MEAQDEKSQERETRTIGPYVLQGEAGRGGTSLVYRAEDPRLGRKVAIKVLALPSLMLPAARDEMTTRFVREARAIAHLSHPNIVTIYDVGEQDEAQYLVMEYLEGQTLETLLRSGPLSTAKAQRIVAQAADALDAVHARGIVHRDIKPANVMVDASGHVKLMDFGIARQHDDTIVTQTGALVGSPSYLSPELVRGEGFTPSSDIWSLGVLLYEMLAGKPPFIGATLPAVLYQVSHESPPPLPGVTPATQAVLERALAKDPEARFPSARALAAAFGASLESSAASPPLMARASPTLMPPTMKAATTTPVPASAPRMASPRPRVPRFVWPLALLAYFGLLGTWFIAHSRVTPKQTLTTPGEQPLTTPGKTAAPAVKVKASRQMLSPRGPRAVPPSVTITETTPKPAPKTARVSRRRASARTALRPRPARVIAKRAQPVTPARSRRSETVRRNPSKQRGPDRDYERIFPAVGDKTNQKPTNQGQTPPRAETGSLLGTWRGRHSRNPATLQITSQQGNAVRGIMTVRTPEATVRVAVAGRQTGGQLALRETRVLSQTRPRAWDLGWETGKVLPNGRMTGTGRDVRGRSGGWSFSR